MSPSSKASKSGNSFSSTLQFLVIFLGVYIISQFVLKGLFPAQFGGTPQTPGIFIRTQSASVRQGNNVVLVLENRTDNDLQLPDHCPMPPVDIFKVGSPGSPAENLQPLVSHETAVACPPLTTIRAHQTVTYTLAPWKYSLLSTDGTYEARLALPEAAVKAISSGATKSGATLKAATGALVPVFQVPVTRFELHEPGTIVKLFRTFISKPFLNFMIWAASWLPGHNLGLAIILLTVVVKLLLFWPTQKALQGQKEMQVLQPKIEDLRTRYKDNPQKLNEETMKLWKEHKVNPMQSCLPTFVQIPVLFGLLYTIRDESNLALSRHLIYPFYQHLDWSFGTDFFGLNLLAPNFWILPILLVVLQFLQMKLAFAISERKAKHKIIDVPSVREVEQEIIDAPKDPVSAQKLQQNMMLYGLPLLIGYMAIRYPAGVSIYWAVSTLFAIAQQLVVNRKRA